jgi:hypothetical protein
MVNYRRVHFSINIYNFPLRFHQSNYKDSGFFFNSPKVYLHYSVSTLFLRFSSNFLRDVGQWSEGGPGATMAAESSKPTNNLGD